MAIKDCVFIIAFVMVVGHTQNLNNHVFPDLDIIMRNFTEVLNNQPASVQDTTNNLFIGVSNSLAAVLLATAKSFNMLTMQKLVAEKKIDMESAVAEFSAGMSNEDASLSVGELITKYKYSMEKHKVITEDGYMLTLFRIPSNGPVVFLMHGLFGSADDYVVTGPDRALAYLLSMDGYDVWMGNARGNKHSRKHIRHKPSDPAFWNFSWHEIGCYDLPVMIDYVLNTTGHRSLKYVGHSQGTTSFFVMASERPEYNKKISLMVALSPVAFMSRLTSPLIRMIAPLTKLIYRSFTSRGIHEFLPDNETLRTYKQLMCGSGHLAEVICSNFLFLIVGFGYNQLNMTSMPVIYGHIPSGASAKQLVHYGQGIMSGDFRMYDHGTRKNKLRYGLEKPPKYKLSNIHAPVALFYSESDWLAHHADVEELYGLLGNTVDMYNVPLDEFNHLDFLWAKDFKKLIYERLIRLIKRF